MSAGVHQCGNFPLLFPSFTPDLSALVHGCSPSWLSVWLSRRLLTPAVLEDAAPRLILSRAVSSPAFLGTRCLSSSHDVSSRLLVMLSVLLSTTCVVASNEAWRHRRVVVT